MVYILANTWSFKKDKEFSGKEWFVGIRVTQKEVFISLVKGYFLC
jgi:hypothetical protein